ncbi:hypothetical protein SK128_016705 [Halocaridina rubra]|uniref:Uncharacterized protein n=1 Tax=Halocaridina rubra TaxID=373956 RepID=A0AAN9A5S6_HALRR
MPRGSDAKWYEPPKPRDWKTTDPTDLQRIESAANLRRNLINQATKNNDQVLINKNSKFKPGRHVMSGKLTQIDRSRSMASLPSTPRVPRGSLLVGSAKSSTESYSVVRPAYIRHSSAARRSSPLDLNATYVFRNRVVSQEEVEKILVRTPPSRTRSPTMTRYEPLPAIKHSASSLREKPGDISSNEIFQPPPLLRSRTFDVFETKLTNLPVVDDEEYEVAENENSENEEEGDDSGEEEDEDGDDEEDSLEDNEMSPDTADSGVVSASSQEGQKDRVKMKNFPVKDTRNDDLFESIPKGADRHMHVLTVTVNIEGKLLSEYLSQIMVGVRKSRPSTRTIRPSIEEEENELEEEEGEDSEEEEKESSYDEDEDSTSSSSNSDGDSRTYSYESEEEEEHESTQVSVDEMGEEEDTRQELEENPSNSHEKYSFEYENPFFSSDIKLVDDDDVKLVDDDDIIVYVKMPDDSLMLVSNPKDRTLKELLRIVKETHVNGCRIVISRKGLEGIYWCITETHIPALSRNGLERSDLSRLWKELEIADNTTFHLIAE